MSEEPKQPYFSWFDDIWCWLMVNVFMVAYIFLLLPLILFYEVQDYLENFCKNKKK